MTRSEMQALMTPRASSRTFTTSKGDTVVSTLSDLDAVRVIREAADAGRNVSSFGLDLCAKMFRYGLSDRQLPWLHKIAMELVAPPAPKALPTTGASLLPLVAMLQTAAQTLKAPRVKVTFPGVNAVPEITLQLSVAGPTAKVPGSLNVTDGGPYGANVWFGRIRLDGTFEPARRCPEHILLALELWAADPVAIAKAHGRRTASCCFCRRKLETRESLAVGYGPICADKFGLPWGGAVATEAERKAEEAALRSEDAQAA